MRRLTLLLAAAVATVAAAPARAETPAACTAFKWPLARERAALSAPGVPAVATGATYPGLGQGVVVTLVPEGSVAYTVKPKRAPKASPSYGAELALPAVTRPGTLQVTLSDEAWVDLVQGGAILRSSDFSGKAGCPGLRKSVRFAVTPGPLALAVSDSAAATIRLDVEPVE